MYMIIVHITSKHNHIFQTGMALNEKCFKDYFAYVKFQYLNTFEVHK